MKTSLVTIVKNRTKQLRNLIAHLEQCDPLPDELVVVWMTSPSPHSLVRSEAFTITHKFVTTEALPIARARNKGLLEARNNALCYMAVDVLPAPDFIAQHTALLTKGTVVVSQAYPGVAEGDLYQGYAFLQSQTQRENYGNSVCDNDRAALFFIHKKDFSRTGGFDDRYDGFGINDEDFLTNCRTLGLAFAVADSVTFRQERANYRCPLNHVLDFTRNAQIYHDKWGVYPNKAVLEQYAQQGCINSDYEENGLHVARLPTDDERKTARLAATHTNAEEGDG